MNEIFLLFDKRNFSKTVCQKFISKYTIIYVYTFSILFRCLTIWMISEEVTTEVQLIVLRI
jgi:hypothetical protein